MAGTAGRAETTGIAGLDARGHAAPAAAECVRSPARGRRSGASGAVAVLILGALFEMLDDLGDLDLRLADLAAADVEQLGGAAQLLRQLVDVDLLALDPLQDPLELLHRLAEAERGLRRCSRRWRARSLRLRRRRLGL